MILNVSHIISLDHIGPLPSFHHVVLIIIGLLAEQDQSWRQSESFIMLRAMEGRRKYGDHNQLQISTHIHTYHIIPLYLLVRKTFVLVMQNNVRKCKMPSDTLCRFSMIQ